MTVSRHGVLDEAGVPQRSADRRLREPPAVKEEDELDAIRRSAALIQPVLEAIADEGLIGRTEREVAWRVRELFHQGGAEGSRSTPSSRPPRRARCRTPSRETSRSSTTPWSPSTWGASWTATAPTAPAPSRPGRRRRRVGSGLRACACRRSWPALALVRARHTGARGDEIVRGVIDGRPATATTSSTAPATASALDIHEGPRFRNGAGGALEPGNVVTVEPGVYLPGSVRGADRGPRRRHRRTGCEVLTRFPKELIVCG